jgi:tripartite-type tricarboxylate transporter receptor subunit TctC
MMMRLAAGAFALLLALTAQAQNYPAKPIRMIVTAAGGGLTDVMTRSLADHVQRTLGQPMIVENRPGAGGATAVEYVARSPADGYTLVIVNVGNAAIAPWVSKALPYDPLKDLTGIAPVGEVPSLFAIHDKLPVKTLKEFLAYAKANPGKINYASAGNATMPHLAAEVLSHMTDISMVHVPYKGGLPAALDLGAGRVHLGLLGIASVRTQLASGQVRVLAVAAPKRLVALPDVPTFEEAGLQGYEVTNWFGILAPTGTPRGIVQTLNREIGLAYESPKVAAQFTAAGILPMKESVEQFQKRIVSDHAKWRDIVQKAGIKPE